MSIKGHCQLVVPQIPSRIGQLLEDIDKQTNVVNDLLKQYREMAAQLLSMSKQNNTRTKRDIGKFHVCRNISC